MTDLRTAAQQALECLKGVARGKYDGNAAEVCAALEAALAQQAEPVEPVGIDCCANCLRPKGEHQGDMCPRPHTTVWHAWDYEFAPPQQAEPVEPVAWVGDHSTQDYASTVPDTQIADRLARHGINPYPDRLARHGIPKP